MSYRSRFFDSVEGDRVIDAAAFAQTFGSVVARSGVVRDSAPPTLQVQVDNPPSLGVRVTTGEAWLEGRFFEVYGSSERVPISPPAGSPRIDRVVVRLDYANRTIYLTTREGLPAASPQPPSLVRNQAIWELSLAQVRVNPGVTFIEAVRITDERTVDAVCGYAYLFDHAAQHAVDGPDPIPHGSGSGLDADLLGGVQHKRYIHLGGPSNDGRVWQVRSGTQAVRLSGTGYGRVTLSPPFPNEKHNAVIQHGNANDLPIMIGQHDHVGERAARDNILFRAWRSDGTPLVNTTIRVNYICIGW